MPAAGTGITTHIFSLLIINHFADLLENRAVSHANYAAVGMDILRADNAARGEILAFQSKTRCIFTAADGHTIAGKRKTA